MQSIISPVLSTHDTQKTREISAFKLILEGRDDSDLVSIVPRRESRARMVAQVEVVDRLIVEAEAQLEGIPDLEDLLAQLGRLKTTIDENTRSVETLSQNRDNVLEARNRNSVRRRAVTLRDAETRTLVGRFQLLMEQYSSDLARLELVREAGSLLGYFSSGACPFCGAAPDDQHFQLHTSAEHATDLVVAVTAEIDKTSGLRSDLRETIDDLAQQLVELDEAATRLDQLVAEQSSLFQTLDREMSPSRVGLTQALEIKAEIDKRIDARRRLQELQSLRAQVQDENVAQTAAAGQGITLRSVREFSTEIQKRLAMWSFPGASDARFDKDALDVVAGDQVRAAHGKGVRSILHAAFTVGLAQYCEDRDLAHPGFVVLDSPLVTYRAPENDGDELEPEVGEAFYRDLATSIGFQVIVAENVDPPRGLENDITPIQFTGNSTARGGLFPPA